jgi:hypothetical protein
MMGYQRKVYFMRSAQKDLGGRYITDDYEGYQDVFIYIYSTYFFPQVKYSWRIHFCFAAVKT